MPLKSFCISVDYGVHYQASEVLCWLNSRQKNTPLQLQICKCKEKHWC